MICNDIGQVWYSYVFYKICESGAYDVKISKYVCFRGMYDMM